MTVVNWKSSLMIRHWVSLLYIIAVIFPAFLLPWSHIGVTMNKGLTPPCNVHVHFSLTQFAEPEGCLHRGAQEKQKAPRGVFSTFTTAPFLSPLHPFPFHKRQNPELTRGGALPFIKSCSEEMPHQSRK